MSQGNGQSNEQPLRPRARIIRALGEELISNETVALIELVKNSYDADAKRVKVRFQEPVEQGKGCIEVIDNGHGMTLDTVRSAFLEPATNSKRGKKHRRSEELHRRMLGEKGIGRFASSRLADELELVTRRKGASDEVYSVFDWTQFDDDDLYLDEVLILTEPRTPQAICPDGLIEALWESDEKPTKRERSRGTILTMSGLKQSWHKQDFEKLQRGLARLVSPLKEVSDFRIFLDLPDEFAEFSSELVPPRLIRYPHYSAKGEIEADGSFSFKYRVHALDTKARSAAGRFAFRRDDDKLLVVRKDHDLAEVRPPECGPLHIELRFWDRDELGNIQQQVGSGTIADVRRDLDAIAGINIYRDSFRVLPYGEPNDDWLRLDIRRVQKPQQRFSNNNIAGYVDITADNNPELHDQTNREGLDENQALDDLRQILTAIISEVETRRQELRPKKSKSSAKTPVGGIFEQLNLDAIRRHITVSYPDDAAADAILQETEKVFAGQLEQIQTVLGRHHALATLGKLIDVVLHDGRHPVATVVTQTELGVRDIEQNGSSECEEILAKIKKRLGTIRGQGEVLRTLFRRIEPFGGRRRGRPSQLYLEKIIDNVIGIFSSEIDRLGVEVTVPKSETLVRVDEAELQEVLANLLDNSLYWLQHVPKGKRRLAVEVQRVAKDHVEITVSDSGPGIDSKTRPHIFDPYFSTKPDGVGLGLCIAGEIVTDYYNGSLEVLDNCPLGGAMFRVALRKRV